MSERLHILVDKKEESQLKKDLNKGVASLFNAPEEHFKPHLCLNEKKGLEVMKGIFQNLDADTAFWLHEHIVFGGSDGVWLNVKFIVFLEGVDYPNIARLSPRQTSYIIKNLPEESRTIVLEKIKTYYFGSVLVEMEKGLKKITEQFEKGNLLIESTHQNRIFDLHREGGLGHESVFYTELDIVGESLAYPFLLGITCFDRKEDGFARADEFLFRADRERETTANNMINLMRMLK